LAERDIENRRLILLIRSRIVFSPGDRNARIMDEGRETSWRFMGVDKEKGRIERTGGGMEAKK